MDPTVWDLAILGFGVFVVGSVGGALVVGVLVVRLPADYFRQDRSDNLWIDRHPAVRWTGIILKNLLGALVVGLGIILSMPGVPGPGILTILLGVMLLDFPGKRRLERWLITRQHGLGPVNRLRRRYGRAPFDLDHAA
jgi:hypothetical protein